MVKPVHIDPEALDEVRGARELLDASRDLGGALTDEFAAMLASIRDAPERFAPLAELRSLRVTVWGALLNRFKYRVVFVELPDLVWVVAFMHQRQRPGYWRSRLLKPPPPGGTEPSAS